MRLGALVIFRIPYVKLNRQVALAGKRELRAEAGKLLLAVDAVVGTKVKADLTHAHTKGTL